MARLAAAVSSGPLLRDGERAMIFGRAYVFDAGTERERSYGLGWAMRRRDADLEIWPDDSLVIVVLSNHGFFDDLDGLVERLARAALALP